MIRAIKQLPDLLRQIVGRLDRVSQILQEGLGGLPEGQHIADRLAALEGRIERVQGEAEAMITRAEGKFSAARAAEERARGMERRAQKLTEELEDGDSEGLEGLEEWAELVQGSHGPGSEAGGMPDVRGDLGVPRNGRASQKEAAKAMKYS